MMFIRSPVPDVVEADLEQALILSPAQNRRLQVRLKDLWKERENVKFHAVILAETPRLRNPQARLPPSLRDRSPPKWFFIRPPVPLLLSLTFIFSKW